MKRKLQKRNEATASMNFQDRWLGLADKCLLKLRVYGAVLTGQPTQQEIVSMQINQIETLASHVRNAGLFSVTPEKSVLLAIATREDLRFNDDIISSVAYLFDRHARAVRLGCDRAESVLTLDETA